MAPLSGSNSRLVVRHAPFNGLKVFSATIAPERARLGERITEWIQTHPRCELTEIVVTQSSDAAFHCVAITVFFREHSPTR
jgi:hypothetical protein